SSSAAARTRPSFTRQAAGSWNAALMPSVYIHILLLECGGRVAIRCHERFSGRDEKFAGGGDNGFRSHQPQAIVMSLGTNTLVAILAGHIVEENTVGNTPRRVLRVGEGVKINNRRVHGRSDMDRPRVVGNQQRRQCQ